MALGGAWGAGIGVATNPLLERRGAVPRGGAWGLVVAGSNSEPLKAGGVAIGGVTSLMVLVWVDDLDPETTLVRDTVVGGAHTTFVLLFREGV